MLSQISFQNRHTIFQTVAGNVPAAERAGFRLNLHAGDGAVLPPGAEQKAQRAASSSKVAEPGPGAQPDEVRQQHGVGAQGKDAGGAFQGQAAPEGFQIRHPGTSCFRAVWRPISVFFMIP